MGRTGWGLRARPSGGAEKKAGLSLGGTRGRRGIGRKLLKLLGGNSERSNPPLATIQPYYTISPPLQEKSDVLA